MYIRIHVGHRSLAPLLKYQAYMSRGPNCYKPRFMSHLNPVTATTHNASLSPNVTYPL